MPTILAATFPSSIIFSISIPHIFLSPTQISLGHFILALTPSEARKSRTDSVAIWIILTASFASRGRGDASLSLMNKVKVRLRFTSDSQVCEPWPLPAVWKRAATTDILSRESILRRTSEFVESVVSSHSMGRNWYDCLKFVIIFV